MYKMLPVCLAISFSFTIAEVKTAKSVKEVQSISKTEVQKLKLDRGSDPLLEINRKNKSPKESVLVRKTKKLKDPNRELHQEEKAMLYQKQMQSLISKEAAKNTSSINVPVLEDRTDIENKVFLEEKLENEGSNMNSVKNLNYIQGPKKAVISGATAQLVREHEDLFFSEYAEGTSNNKYLEIYNGTGSDVDLSNYLMFGNYNGNDINDTMRFEAGTVLTDGDVYVIAHAEAAAGIVEQADSLVVNPFAGGSSYITSFNGDDVRLLAKISGSDTTIIDAIGTTDFDGDGVAGEGSEDDPGSGFAVAGVSNATKDYTLVRKSSVDVGNNNWLESAGSDGENSEWLVMDKPSATYTPETLGSHEVEMDEDGPYLSEDFEGEFPSAGWSTDGAGPWVQFNGTDFGPGFAASGELCMFFNDYDYVSGTSGVLYAPEVDLMGAVEPQLKFQYWDAGGSDVVDVQVSNPDGSFSSVFITPAATAGWEELVVDLSAYNGLSVVVRFVGNSVWGTSNPHIDDVHIAEPPTFPIASLSTEFVSFGTAFIGGSKSVDVAISNTGGADLTATSSSTNPKFTVSAIPARIAAGTTAIITMTYTATEVMDDEGYIVFTHNGDSSPDSVMVFGSGSLNPLTEGFEYSWVGDPSAPAGWSQISVSGTTPWRQYASSFSSYTGIGSAIAPWAGAGGQHLLISPAIDLTPGYNLKFYLDGSTSAGTDLKVQIGASNTDGTTGWTDLAHYVAGGNMPASYEEVVISLADYTGVHYVAFRMLDANGYSFYMDDVTIEPLPTTAEVSLSQTGVDFGEVFVTSSSSETVSIINDGGADAFGTIASTNDKFVIGSTNLAVAFGSIQDLVITYTPTAVTATEDTGYIVLTHNGASSPDSVMVMGAGTEAILVEDFEGPWTGTPSAPGGWSQISVSGSTPWVYYSYYGAAYGAWASAGGEHVLITPALDVTAGYNLSFMLDGSANAGTDLKVQIGASNADGTTGWTDLAHYVAGTNMPATWEEQVISLSAHTGVQYIAFRLLDANGWSLFMDDVRVEPQPETPVLVVGANELSFMATEVGSTNSQSISITNTGTGDLSGTIVYTAGFSGPASFSASDASIAVTFSPTTAGMFAGTVSITSTGGDDIINVSGNAGTSVANWDTDLNGDGEADWPAGWLTAQEIPGVGSGWDFFGGGGHTGDGYTSASAGGFQTVNSDWLMSPKYSIVDGSSFTFYASDDGGSETYPDIMTVHVSTTGGDSFTDFDVPLDTVINMGQSWMPYGYDLSAYAGTEVRLAIVYRGEYGYGLNVDDIAAPAVVVEAGPVIYEYPTALDFSFGDAVTNVATTDTTLFEYFNIGGSNLEITAVAMEGPFTIHSDVTFPISTAPGAIGSFGVVFSPLADSLYMGSMTIANNAGADLVIPLYGFGFDGVYRETFGNVGADGYLSAWSEGWAFSDDGVRCPTDQACSNATGASWGIAALSGNGLMYHTYNTATDADTAISSPIVLPTLAAGFHYELDTDEYIAYGADATDVCGIAVSIDNGATFTLIGEADYASTSATYSNNYDLTGYAGQTVHFALIYKGTYANAWGVSTMEVRKKENSDSTNPVLSISTNKLTFGAVVVNHGKTLNVAIMNSSLDVLIEELSLSFTSYQAIESSTLQNNVDYYLKISGSYGVASGHAGDAAYYYEASWCNDETCPVEAKPWTWNGQNNQNHYPQGYNSDHIYYYYFTSDGSVEEFGFEDGGGYGDNNGSLNIEIWKVGAQETGNFSGNITYPNGFSGPETFSSSDSSIYVEFLPENPGVFEGIVTITSNGGDALINVSGNAGASVATWDEDLDADGDADWPIGWETFQADSTVGSGWAFYGGGAHTGDGYVYAEAGGNGTVNSDWLVSPKYTIGSGDMFSFYARDDGGSSAYPDIMTVHVSPTGNNMSEDDFTVVLDTVINMGQSWMPYGYDLSAYAGTEVRLAIVYRGEWGYGLNIDDIAAPTIATVSSITLLEPNDGETIYISSEYDSTYFTWDDTYNNSDADSTLLWIGFVDPDFEDVLDYTYVVVSGSGDQGYGMPSNILAGRMDNVGYPDSLIIIWDVIGYPGNDNGGAAWALAYDYYDYVYTESDSSFSNPENLHFSENGYFAHYLVNTSVEENPYHNLDFSVDLNQLAGVDSMYWDDHDLQITISDCYEGIGDNWYNADWINGAQAEWYFYSDCEAGTDTEYQLRVSPGDNWSNNGYEPEISEFTDYGMDTTIYHDLDIQPLPEHYVGITESGGIPGDTVSVSIYANLGEDFDMNAFQVTIAGLGGGDISAVGVDTSGTIMSSDWMWSYLISDSGNIVITAGAGAESVQAIGSLFNVQFVIDESSSGGLFPIFVTDVMFNEDEEMEFETESGGIMVLGIGDVSMNGSVSAFDASLILQHLVGLDTLGLDQESIGDVTDDNSLSALDAAIILDHVVGLVDELPYAPGGADVDGLFAIVGGTTEPGLTFEVPIKLTDGSSVRSFELEFSYDTEALSVEQIVWDTEVLSGLQVLDNQQDGVVKVSAAGMSSLPSGALTLGYIKFSMDEFFNGYETSVTISRARANESDAVFDASVGVYSNAMLVVSDWGDGGVPMEFALKQNYPNPFNPSTLIRYQLPEETNVTVSIYDIMGRKVRTLLASENQLAGYRQVMWNATNDLGQPVSAGMYIYMIQAGEFRQTKKMVLMK